MFQDMRTTRDGCALLAEKVGHLALSVLHEATCSIEAGPITSHMAARLEQFYEHVSSILFTIPRTITSSFSRKLNEISEFMTSRLSLQTKWYEKVLGRDSLQSDLDYHTDRLEQAYKTFNVCWLVSVRYSIFDPLCSP